MEHSNGWKLLGWLVVLIFVYLVVLGIIWGWKPIHPIIGMYELDTQIETSVPADIPVSAFTNLNDFQTSYPVGVRVINVDRRETFVTLIRNDKNPGRLIIDLSLNKVEGCYKIIKSYYYLPQNKYSRDNQTIIMHDDIYEFHKVVNWKRAYIIKITPQYVTYQNMQFTIGNKR